MKEHFLHYLWRMKRFDTNNLITTEGERITIQNAGEHNLHAGPDFLNARIYIGDTLWAGHVEIHVKSSEWRKHKHQFDKAYDNVILHVVLEDDEPVCRQNGERIPCLELRKRIPVKMHSRYQKMIHNEHWIPCQFQFHSVGEIIKNLWLDRMLVERLEKKTTDITHVLKNNKNDWETTLYYFLARSFGTKVNAEPFELLARQTPHSIIAKHKSNLFQIEALLFGQAGFLQEDFKDDYPKKLKKEYQFLQKKYNLIPLKKESFRFLRMRPANFPSIRIAQFAVLLFQSNHFFSKILAAENIQQIENMFRIKLSPYWTNHYRFDKESARKTKPLGKASIHLFIINTVAPFLFLYGKHKDESRYKDRALKLLEELPAEHNNIITEWKNLGIKTESAYQTQALLQLKNEYCQKQKCLQCAIGNRILAGRRA
ncbi:MAG: DUF2851 family protein [Saprospiraceae bacterium]